MKSSRFIAGLTVLALAFALFAVPAMAKPKTEHVRGTISKVSDSGFTVATGDGSRQVTLASKTKIAGVVPSSLDAIESGTFIGTANVEHDGNNKALEVVVFPESMKGLGLGDYPWDLSPSDVGADHSDSMKMGGGSSMTNGTVTQSISGDAMKAGGSSMTNGTVTQADSAGMMSVTVDYGKDSKTIRIPRDVPVVALQKGSKSDLKKGAHVFVAGPEGSDPFEAKMVLVGIDGTVPPM